MIVGIGIGNPKLNGDAIKKRHIWHRLWGWVFRRFLDKNISPQIPDFFRKVGDLSGVSG
jgi:hypothetical protein